MSQDITFTTADGLTLEGELDLRADATAGMVACHPHPLHGGNMRSLGSGELYRVLPDRGWAVLRFNFRGVGGSEGAHGGGEDEVHDIVAAIDALAAAAPGLPLVLAGYSFGADVSLRVDDARLAGWVAVAPPLRIVDPALMSAATDARPKLLLVPEHDQFDPPDRVQSVTATWTNTTIEVVAGADHFLVGRTDRVVEVADRTARAWVS